MPSLLLNLLPDMLNLHNTNYFEVKFHLLKGHKDVFLLSFFSLANALESTTLCPFFERTFLALPMIFRSKPGYLCLRIFIILSLDRMQQLHNLFFSTFIHVYYSSLFCAKEKSSLSTLECMCEIS